MRARLPIYMARITAAALLLAACLPGDTRPPPAVIHLTVEPSLAVTEGVTTADGWHISFERLLVGIGRAELGARGNGHWGSDDSECTIYANANYERLFDVTVGGRQTLSDIYGLGTCGVSFSLSPAGSDAPLGAGVSAQDFELMRDWENRGEGWKGPLTMYVRGQAKRDATTKRFEWSLRQWTVFRGCVDASGLGFASDVVLTSGAVLSLPVVVHGEELFRESPSEDSPLRFDALAAADADGDQIITLEELGGTVSPMTEGDAGLTSEDGGTPSITDLFYRRLVPRMLRLRDSGPCLGGSL